MWSKRIHLFIVLLLFFYSLHAEEEYGAIRWEEVPGAIGYIVEIRNMEGRTIDNKRISTNYYLLDKIQPGIYEHRIGIINKFGKVDVFSEWVKFEIVQTKNPIITTKTIFSASKQENEKKINLEGDYFLPEMKIYLQKGNTIIQPKKYNVNPPKKVEAVINIKEIQELGVYDIILENPKGKKSILPGSFIIGLDPEKVKKYAKKQERILNNEVPPDYYSTPYWSTLWRSSLIPGWGQYYIDDANWKLVFYPFVLLIAVDAYYSNYTRYMESRRIYNRDTQFGLVLYFQQNPDLFFANYLKTEQTFKTAKQRYERTRLASGGLILFAVFNLMDSLLSARKYSLTVLNESPNLRLLDSKWQVSLNSSPRDLGEWKSNYWEEYANLEFRLDF